MRFWDFACRLLLVVVRGEYIYSYSYIQGGAAQLHPAVGSIAHLLEDIRSLGRFLVKRGRTVVQAQFYVKCGEAVKKYLNKNKNILLTRQVRQQPPEVI